MTDCLVLPCSVCSPAHAVTVDEGKSVIRCNGCGRERPLVVRAMYMVSGAPATGKTGLVERLAGRMDGLAVFDTDLFGAVAHSEWEAWATSWLLVAHGLAGTGVSTVLCGYGMHRWKVQHLAARRLVGAIHTLNLDLDDDVLRSRLRERPRYDADRVERKVRMAGTLRADADLNVDTTGLAPGEVSAIVEEWLLSRFPRSAGNISREDE